MVSETLAESPIPETPEWTLVIRPERGLKIFDLSELWLYRELLFFLTWRDVSVRYKQTILGASWAIIQPFMTMVVFSIFFGNLAGVPADGTPYPIFSYTALLPWTFFANAMNQAANSLVSDANLVSKVYFPRLLIPTSRVLGGVVDFLIAFLLLIVLMVVYEISPRPAILLTPLFFGMAMMASLAVSLWLSALNVQFRDVRYAMPFLTQFLLFLTPIAYPSSLLNEPLRTLYGLNPMAGVVEGFRWCLLGTPLPEGLVMVSLVVTVVILLSGLYYFHHVEDTFADVI
jgi:lipopolysaccharide transport system permease protein